MSKIAFKPATPPAPKVVFGMPVRNGAAYIEDTIRSVLSQDYENLEFIISDNASDDDTVAIVQRIAREDPRLRLFCHERNIGQNPNFNWVLGLAEGTYFRWIGMDDYVMPDYARRCVEMMEADRELIGVTTNQNYHDDEGNTFFRAHDGERLTSRDPAARFAKMLWFLRSDYRFIDPIYSMYRLDALRATPLLRAVPVPDQALSIDIALQGPMGHVPATLCGRRRVPAHYLLDHTDEYLPGQGEKVRYSVLGFARTCWDSTLRIPMTRQQRYASAKALAQHSGIGLRQILKGILREKTPPELRRNLKRVLRPSA